MVPILSLLIASDILARHGFEIVWGLAMAGFGALLGVGLQALVTPATASDSEAGGHGPSMTVIVAHVDPPRPQRRAPARAEPIFDDDDRLLIGAALALASVAVYLRWRSVITAGVADLSLFLYGCELGMIGYIAARGVLRRAQAVVITLGTLLVVVVGFADARALRAPRFDAGRYSRLTAAFDHGGLSRVIDRFGANGVLFVLYQVLGVIVFVTAVALALAALATVLGRLNQSLGSRGHWLWDAFSRLTGRPLLAATFACLFAGVSWLLCSGLGYDVIHR